ncbi:hypothetical protein BS47DRAFT_1083031 [Hydnum rufescens UP504]|uniref:Uncharacterized protein n=1 Tax=Hydnum rufescens UP504 TaxID=1448309 RepID=A0A9P6B9F4_9AGAM|nr:hypothetical protein BS47DRAFT_1083031 [Hydnum rufescens UP504]
MTINRDGVALIVGSASSPKSSILDLLFNSPASFLKAILGSKSGNRFHHGIPSVQHTRCEHDCLTHRVVEQVAYPSQGSVR